jgi:hypothetical protein
MILGVFYVWAMAKNVFENVNLYIPLINRDRVVKI